MAVMKTAYKVAKSEGRLCTRCGWVVTKKDWKKGIRKCRGCTDAEKGAGTPYGHGPYRDESIDRTGDMP